MLKTAILKRGIPSKIYLDNASYYRSPLVQTIGGRLGMKVIYCTPYSPYKKGKIERFWLRLKREFISHLSCDKKYTLEELNRLILTWVEKDYHHEKHSTLKKTPLEAWMEKTRSIRYPDAEIIEKDFLAEETRRVRRDGSIPLKSRYYDVDSLYAGEHVTVRYNPFKRDKIYIYLHGELLQESYPVDELENQKTVRRKIRECPEQAVSGINFIELLKQEEKNNV